MVCLTSPVSVASQQHIVLTKQPTSQLLLLIDEVHAVCLWTGPSGEHCRYCKSGASFVVWPFTIIWFPFPKMWFCFFFIGLQQNSSNKKWLWKVFTVHPFSAFFLFDLLKSFLKNEGSCSLPLKDSAGKGLLFDLKWGGGRISKNQVTVHSWVEIEPQNYSETKVINTSCVFLSSCLKVHLINIFN